MIPADAVPAFGEYRTFLMEHYKVPEEDVDRIVEEYDIRCSPSERRLLFPYWWHPTTAHTPTLLAVWGRALPPYNCMSYGSLSSRYEERPRYYLRGEKSLFVPKKKGAYKHFIITEGAMDAIKLNEYLWTDVLAVASYGVHWTQDMMNQLKQMIMPEQKVFVVYDTGAFADAAKVAQEIRKVFPNTFPKRFPEHKDPGNATPEQLKEWYAASF